VLDFADEIKDVHFQGADFDVSSANPHQPIVVAIVEDDRATREGLGLLIDGTPGYRCVAKFRSVEDALNSTMQETPRVLLLDIRLPGMRGCDGIGVLKEKFPSIQILMLTINADEDSVFESICKGACGYLLKNTGLVQLIEALRELYDGGSPMSANIARKLVTVFREQQKEVEPVGILSHRENEILQLLAKGLLYKEIAEQISISVSTVRQHIHHIYEKLHVQNRTEAINKAFRKN